VSVLALVPARGGSKGLPGKNVRVLAGRTLLGHAAEAARRSGVVDRIVLSSDSADIIDVARREGIETPFVRPADLAQDDTPMLPVIEDAVQRIERDGWPVEIVVLLQPTSPLRTPRHIADAVGMLRQSGADSVVTVVEVPRHLSPDYVMRVDNGTLKPFLAEGARVTRRQDARVAYVRDGTVYAFWRRTLAVHGSIYGEDCRPLIIPAAESLTIDTPDDWAEAERRVAGVEHARSMQSGHS
jgi:CMP-N,N'-diacetyllegionaminic acid synthase